MVPSYLYAYKECLLISSSLTTCDPDDISQTIDDLVGEKISVMVICLSAQVYILEQIALKTNGSFNVV